MTKTEMQELRAKGAFLKTIAKKAGISPQAVHAKLYPKSRRCKREVFVYFVQVEQFVKIGVAVDLERRLGQLALYSPFPVKLIGVMRGTRELEKALHRKFVHLHHMREWFRAEAELIDFARESSEDCDFVVASETAEA